MCLYFCVSPEQGQDHRALVDADSFLLWSPFTSWIYQCKKFVFQERNQNPVIFLMCEFKCKLTSVTSLKCWEVLPEKAQFGVLRLQWEPVQLVHCHRLNKQRLEFVFLHMNVFSGAQNRSGKRYLELKDRIFFVVVVWLCWGFLC